MLSIIVATDTNGGIGKNNKLLFHIKEDLKRFKDLTMNHKVIMGMNTFISLPCQLKGREEIVLTRKKINDNHNYATIINNIDEIIYRYKDSEEEAFVIGGGQIYKQLLPHCKKIYWTTVVGDYEADTFFKINPNEWEGTYWKLSSDNENKYEFMDLIRKENKVGENEFLSFVEGRIEDIKNELTRQGFLLTNTKTTLMSMIDKLMQEATNMDEY